MQYLENENVPPELRAILPEVVRRVRARRERGEVPERPRLPARKSDFPKLLCLDQTHWIRLAQVANGKAASAGRTAAMLAVREAVAARKLIVAVTDANAVELSQRVDRGSRERLSAFMVEFSGNVSLVNHLRVNTVELRNAVIAEFLGGARKLTPIREQLAQRGMAAATTGHRPRPHSGDPRVDDILGEALLEPEISKAGLTYAIAPELMRPFVARDAAAAAAAKQVQLDCAKMSPTARKRMECRALLTGGSMAARLTGILQRLERERPAFDEWLEDDSNLDRFAAAVPSIDVMSTLLSERDKNPFNPSSPNDGRDLVLFELALPYANVLVAEKHWAAIANQAGLPKRYDTAVLAKTEELPEILATLGCIGPAHC